MVKHHDWRCLKCNFLIFGSKLECSKCGEKRSVIRNAFYNGPDSRFYDWTCPSCKIFIFGSKTYCLKCNVRNPLLPCDLGQK